MITTIEELKKIAKQKKMTYQDIADKSGIPVGTLNNIFSSKNRNPRIDTIQKIERALGLGWTEEEQNKGISPVVVRNLTVEEDEMLELFRELGEKKGGKAQASVIRLLEDMIEL